MAIGLSGRLFDLLQCQLNNNKYINRLKILLNITNTTEQSDIRMFT